MDNETIDTLVRHYFDGHTLNPGRSASDAAIARLLDQVKAGGYRDAYLALRQEPSLDTAGKQTLIAAVNSAYLFERSLEWTNHGILRSFRFWTTEEKVSYLLMTRNVMSSLKKISPFVSLGFGSVLAIMRDGDFIPHDDDMDILIAFEAKRMGKFSTALEEIRDVLTADGYGIHGQYPSHRNVNWKGGKAVDVFVGFIEDGDVSWFPSRRRNLKVNQLFPVRSIEMFGVECEIPNEPEEYLAATYGPDWRTPIANWNHPWNQAEYSDLL